MEWCKQEGFMSFLVVAQDSSHFMRHEGVIFGLRVKQPLWLRLDIDS